MRIDAGIAEAGEIDIARHGQRAVGRGAVDLDPGTQVEGVLICAQPLHAAQQILVRQRRLDELLAAAVDLVHAQPAAAVDDRAVAHAIVLDDGAVLIGRRIGPEAVDRDRAGALDGERPGSVDGDIAPGFADALRIELDIAARHAVGCADIDRRA